VGLIDVTESTLISDLELWLDNHVVRGAHLRAFSHSMKTKKYRRYDKNNLSNSQALLCATVKGEKKKIESKIHHFSM
jgi:hypothetical protein